VSAEKTFIGNRSIEIRENEINVVKEFGLNYKELIKTFDVMFNIPRRLNEKILKNAF
jgi:hypothetical protein